MLIHLLSDFRACIRDFEPMFHIDVDWWLVWVVIYWGKFKFCEKCFSFFVEIPPKETKKTCHLT